MDRQTTTWSKLTQLMALVFVLVAVSACSQKEGSKTASRRNLGRSNIQTPTGTGPQAPGQQYSNYGIIYTNQYAVQGFVNASDSSIQLGQVSEVAFTGKVSDGYFANQGGMQKGGSMSLIIKDSLGQLQADYNCEMYVFGQNQVEVTCANDQGSILFRGQANSNTYSGQVYYNNGQQLGNFTVRTCKFLDDGIGC